MCAYGVSVKMIFLLRLFLLPLLPDDFQRILQFHINLYTYNGIHDFVCVFHSMHLKKLIASIFVLLLLFIYLCHVTHMSHNINLNEGKFGV